MRPQKPSSAGEDFCAFGKKRLKFVQTVGPRDEQPIGRRKHTGNVGGPDFGEMRFVSPVNRGATSILQKLSDGSLIPTGRFVMYRENGIGQLVLNEQIDFEKARVSSYSQTTAWDGTLVDEFTLAFDSAADASPPLLLSKTFEFETRRRDVYVVGTTPDYFDVLALRIAAGRVLPGGDVRRGERVTVIGSRLAREVFGGANPLGSMVRIADTRFRVIGVLEPKGTTLGIDFDDHALVPPHRVRAWSG